MDRKPYDTDLTDAQWALIEPLIPPRRWWGRPAKHELREIMNAIIYVTRAGVQWRNLPHDFPAWSTVYDYYRIYRDNGVWEAINDALRKEVRARINKQEAPTGAIIDSCSVKSTAIPGPRGYDAGKKVNGRKRSVITDTLGLVLRVAVHPANVSDLKAGKEVADWVAQEVVQDIKKIWGDSHYADEFAEYVKSNYGWEVEYQPRPEGAVGFVALPFRWAVERTFAWLTWWRRLSKDYEGRVASSEAMVYIAMMHLMLRRLTK